MKKKTQEYDIFKKSHMKEMTNSTKLVSKIVVKFYKRKKESV